MKTAFCVLLSVMFVVIPASRGDADERFDAPPAGSQAISSLILTDLSGKPHVVVGESAGQFSVVVFISPDCPIANAYQPTLARLAEQFQTQGIGFYFVHPLARVTQEKAEQHVDDFGITVPVVLDNDLTIARQFDAKVTPEAFLVDSQGAIRYRGRISDLYAGFGKKRQQARTHDLHDAITAVLAGREPASTETKPVGCLIQYR